MSVSRLWSDFAARLTARMLVSVVTVVAVLGLATPSDRASTVVGPSLTAPTPVQSAGPDSCPVLWRHPVAAPVTDGYRPPANPYGPGNRGLEYGTVTGDPVTAVADGVVSFAGPVGRSRFVVIEHGVGLRSTYGFLQSIAVSRDDRIVSGEEIATALEGFHLTARIGPHYRDPTPLLRSTCYAVRLVPVPDGFS